MLAIKVKLTIEISEEYFDKDFLDIEVKKRMAINGRDLLYKIKDIHRREVKDEYGNYFKSNILYLITGVKNGNIIFIET